MSYGGGGYGGGGERREEYGRPQEHHSRGSWTALHLLHFFLQFCAQPESHRPAWSAVSYS